MGTHRRLVVPALAAGAVGCTLLSGVDDLTVDDGAMAVPDRDATALGPTDAPSSSGDAQRDGAVDAGADAAPRVRNIDFEDGQLVHPTSGGDRVAGDAIVIGLDAGTDEAGFPTTPRAIGGNYSMYVDGNIGFVEEGFSPLDEVFATLRVRLEQPVTSSTVLVLIQNEVSPHVFVELDATQRLTLRVGANAVGTTAVPLEPGKIVRLGLHVKKGRNDNGEVQALLAADGAAFGAAFAARTKLTIARPTRIQFGAVGGAGRLIFDDVKLDDLAFPAR